MARPQSADLFPFPVEDPPPYQLARGLLLSIVGMVLITLGLMGGGLSANGVAWFVIQTVAAETHHETVFPANVWTFLILLVAIPIGLALAVYAISEGARLRERGRRLRARDARQILRRAQPKPVLLLRSFIDEELQEARPVDLFQRRFEERLVHVLSRIGPVIALGRPGDIFGFAGAARLCVQGNYWQTAVEHLMNRAGAVVVLVNDTDGLLWEIRTALKLVPREQLLFVFPCV